MPTSLIDPVDGAVPVYALKSGHFSKWLGAQSARLQAWVKSSDFAAKANQTLLLPGADGGLDAAIYIRGEEAGPWGWTSFFGALPKSSTFHFVTELDKADANDAALAFVLASYSFDRYRTTKTSDVSGPFLVWPEKADQAAVRRAHGATTMIRDLVNTPASDLGPAQLAKAAKELAEASHATYSEVVGVDLIREGYPAIYAVGRGAEDSRAPRLIDFTWGKKTSPKVTLVGKGVCFDTGGLDIKSAAGMKIMKKDMGGAAHVLGLASMIMAAHLDVRLRVLTPAVENSVSDAATRPLDVVASRKGLTIEIGHTDAEGRVVLADALALASEENPEMILDFATLTGAARVALGTDLPALFCNDDDLAQDILAAAEQTADPLWRMPLYQPYKQKTHGKIADLSNDTDGPYGGAIMAGLFLEAFVKEGISWAHIDLMAWNLRSRPGRPEGGEALTVRAMYSMLENRFGY
ncbi:MAG: leucyl aminopeptidase family protein [Magnetovibrio sp.]|nr:leucyl aminopeptidase family protein [Magnetovibrio sp.]